MADKAVNIVLDEQLWHALTIACAKLSITKRAAVTEAIAIWLAEHDPATAQEWLPANLRAPHKNQTANKPKPAKR